MNRFDSQIRLEILEQYLDGRPPTVDTVAAARKVAADEVSGAFRRLAEGRAIVLVPGTTDILMAAPFAGDVTDHVVTTPKHRYHANCIWDAFGIPAMLAAAGRPAEATITTRCEDCGAPLTVDVRDGHVAANPPRPVAHFAVPAARWWADIVFT